MTDNAALKLSFSGSNWEDLNRLVALGKFKFMIDNDFYYVDDVTHVRSPNPEAQCAWLASQFSGPALDWVASIHATAPKTFASFDGFVAAVRQGFGVAEDNITALCRRKLNDLRMGADVPAFFAELDRLYLVLAITGDSTKIAYAESKLSPYYRTLLAEQGRLFHNYSTMREHLNSVWALSASIPDSQRQTGGRGRRGKKATTTPVAGGSKN